jgi:hypothetical protein
VILARVEHGPILANAARAEVEATHELSHDEDVDRVAAGRPEVRVDVELRS